MSDSGDPVACLACQAPLSVGFSRQEYWRILLILRFHNSEYLCDDNQVINNAAMFKYSYTMILLLLMSSDGLPHQSGREAVL